MTTESLNLLGFVLTVILACFSWVLGVNVFLNNRKGYLNITLALTCLFVGLWLLSGFIEKVFANPSDTFTVWTFRWAYAAGYIGYFCFFLFLLGMYLGRAPRKRTLIGLSAVAVATAVVALTPWAIESASYSEGSLTSSFGALFTWLVVYLLVNFVASIYLAVANWRRSTGIDRARASIILFSIAFFLTFALLFSHALPAITGNDLYTSYSFIAVVIPLALTSYAIIRLRLLDVRIIIRRTGVFLLNLLILTAPLFVLALAVMDSDLSPSGRTLAMLLPSVVLISIAPFCWRVLERYSSRVFFSGLYDSTQLKEAAERSIHSSFDPFKSIPSTLRPLISSLGLEGLDVLILPHVMGEHGLLFECKRGEEGSLVFSLEEEHAAPGWLEGIDATIIAEELQRWPRDSREERLGSELAAWGVSACIPITVTTGLKGHFLCGAKADGRALSVTDIGCLEEIGRHLAVYIDNYALSSELNVRMKELEKVYEELRGADEFKSEIIQVISHELRTPATIINGFGQVLMEKWDRMSDEDKLSAFDSMYKACLRINDITGQVTLLTDCQRGRLESSCVPINVSKLVEETRDAFDGFDRERIDNRLNRDDLVFSDPVYFSTILRNIISNALRFSPAQEPVLVSGQDDDDCYCLYVRDFGRGIPLEKESDIFEPFVRLENVMHHTRGAGLGLYIVRTLSSLLGIRICVDSSPADGTTFKLFIPLS